MIYPEFMDEERLIEILYKAYKKYNSYDLFFEEVEDILEVDDYVGDILTYKEEFHVLENECYELKDTIESLQSEVYDLRNERNEAFIERDDATSERDMFEEDLSMIQSDYDNIVSKCYELEEELEMANQEYKLSQQIDDETREYIDFMSTKRRIGLGG